MDGHCSISGLVRQPIRTQSGDKPPPDLLLIDGVADSQALAALGAATAKNGATPTVFHAGAETLLVGTLAVMRLECSFHGKTFLVEIQNFEFQI